MKPEGQAVSLAKVKPSVAPASFAAQATAQRRQWQNRRSGSRRLFTARGCDI